MATSRGRAVLSGGRQRGRATDAGGRSSCPVVQPQRQHGIQVVHEFLESPPVFAESVPILGILRKRDAQTEQAGRDDAVLLVVFQLAPLWGGGQFSALEADGVD